MATSSNIELTRIRRQPPSSIPLPPPLLASPHHGGPGPVTASRFFNFTTEDYAHGSLPSPRHGGGGFSGSGIHDEDDHDHDDSAAAYADALAAIRPLWRRTLFALLEHPTSSTAAFVLQMTSTALIVFSAFVTVLETVPAVHSISGSVWFGVETSVVALFTVEYAARCVAWSYSWPSLFHWVFSFYGVIDLLSVLPYYLELLLRQDTSVYFRFSILRMFRLLRVFRPFRYNHTILLTMEVMYLSVRRSQHALLAIGFFVFMILTVFSTLLYFAERGVWDELLGTFVNVDGDPTQFSSIPAAAWFVLVTITTVGYGEITPRSFLGRLITLPILVFGLLLITLPSFVLGREFSVVWEAMTRGRGRAVGMGMGMGGGAGAAGGGVGTPGTDRGLGNDGSPEEYADQEDGENTPLTRGDQTRAGAGAAETVELGPGGWREAGLGGARRRGERSTVSPAGLSSSSPVPHPPVSARPTRDPLYSPVYPAMPSGMGSGMGGMGMGGMGMGGMSLPAPYSSLPMADYGFGRGSPDPQSVNGSALDVVGSGGMGAGAGAGVGSGAEADGTRASHLRSHSLHPSPNPSQGQSQSQRARDLTNLKLAQNQTELSRQIEELAGAVEVQRRLLAVLVERLGTGSGAGVVSGGDSGDPGVGGMGGLGIVEPK